MSATTTSKGERRRRQLIEAAAELLREGGFEAVRHRAVAERAGVPLASTTYYFDSLDDLIAGAVESSAVAELAAIRDQVDSVSRRRRGARATVDLIVTALIGADDDPDREPIVARCERLAASARYPEVLAVHARLASQFLDLMADVIRRSGRRASREDLRNLLRLAQGTMLGSMIEADAHPRESVRDALLSVIDVLAPPVG
ncbi:TetR family transcriptional regulator [Rhodococcus sp. D2-41]|uniref:TetR family transcriptional regulator n=1 Tax=Speluncibacter jeojiensis TaxID=2710754 RepID=A0A9X4RED8_9ACTN|nr:TetR family transcriptional regulator [Rhodococcus sp. D2-41]MDG3011546.1 TetR family transcriptional regulator [Rhodococcus sp. D2-41]MDG3015097.1 TetR family transcriptional regulator [Corynebacteriales bacterium D3-21]